MRFALLLFLVPAVDAACNPGGNFDEVTGEVCGKQSNLLFTSDEEGLGEETTSSQIPSSPSKVCSPITCRLRIDRTVTQCLQGFLYTLVAPTLYSQAISSLFPRYKAAAVAKSRRARSGPTITTTGGDVVIAVEDGNNVGYKVSA